MEKLEFENQEVKADLADEALSEVKAPKEYAVKWTHFLLFIGLFLGIGIIVGIFLGIFDIFSEANIVELFTAGYIGLILDAVIFFIALFSFKRIRKFVFAVLDFSVLREKKTYLYLLAGFVIFYLSQYLFIEVVKLDDNTQQAVNLGTDSVNNLWQYILAAFSLALITPIKEELLYRGIAHQFLQERHNFWVGLIVTSLIFGLSHLGTPFSAIIMGVVFVLLFKLTKSLVPSILLHIVWNTLVLSLMFLS